jgi:hypothetical protein
MIIRPLFNHPSTPPLQTWTALSKKPFFLSTLRASSLARRYLNWQGAFVFSPAAPCSNISTLMKWVPAMYYSETLSQGLAKNEKERHSGITFDNRFLAVLGWAKRYHHHHQQISRASVLGCFSRLRPHWKYNHFSPYYTPNLNRYLLCSGFSTHDLTSLS